MIQITERNDILASAAAQITLAHAAYTDTGDSQLVARRLIARSS